MMGEQNQSSRVSNDEVLSLSALSQALKETVESVYDQVRVRAEISRPTIAASGHVYFTLKDESAVLDAVCWKGVASGLSVVPEEGLDVIATGKLTTYAGRSKYQLVVKDIVLAGEGALLKQLEDRKRMLAAEGLFESGRKKAIPSLPQVIGVITSPTGAVIRDILHRLEERFPVRVLVWPVLVQGKGAAEQISGAIRGFDAMVDGVSGVSAPKPDVVILARGGGSFEDLMAFNDESVVRAVALCRVPLISAVGHETDTTLVDYASDLRAPTPTAAAEMAVPVRSELSARLADMGGRLERCLGQRLEHAGQRVRSFERALGEPEMLLASKSQGLDLAFSGLERVFDGMFYRFGERLRRRGERLPPPSEALRQAELRLSGLDVRGVEAMARRMAAVQSVLSGVVGRLDSPVVQLADSASRLDIATSRLQGLIEQTMSHEENRLVQAGRVLEAASFERILDKGFALVKGADGQVMRSAEQYAEGAVVHIRLAEGARDAILGRPPAHKEPQSSKPQKKRWGGLF